MANQPRTVRTPGTPSPSAQNARPPEVAETAAGDGGTELGNAVDIDPRALRAPVLTKQGWICPDEDWQKKYPEKFQALLDAQG